MIDETGSAPLEDEAVADAPKHDASPSNGAVESHAASHPGDNPGPEDPDESTETGEGVRSFADMNLEPEIQQALDDMGYETPMAVQTAVFQHVMEGRDIMVQSHTGSGKTAAFGIPIAQKIDGESSGVQVLILAPTRELALQVAEELKRITHFKSLTVVPIYGGAPMKPQIDALDAGAQIVAGTPGRVLDHIRRKTLRTGGIKLLVLDECDEMLSMGFQEEIENILATLPPREERQTMLFSATIPDSIERIARRHMREPDKISLSDDSIGVSDISHYYYLVSGLARTRDLLKVLKTERPDSAIIFCNTREDTSTVAKFLSRHGYDAEAISSDLTQRDRERVMKRSRDKNLQFLVATDIAARGIDISDLSHVINYQFPESPEVYVHRTGRTGRAGKAGVAISLVGPREIGAFYYLKLIYKIRPEERELPSAEELLTMQEGEQYERVVSMVPEKPSAQYLSLARRLWQSVEGERVVAALLERLLTPPAKPAAAAATAAVASPAPARSRSPRSRRDSRSEDAASATSAASADERSERGGASETDPVEASAGAEAAAPSDAPATSPATSPAVDAAGEAASETKGEDGEGGRRRRRRRGGAGEDRERTSSGERGRDRGGRDRGGRGGRGRDRDRGGRTGERRVVARGTTSASDEGREFWEAWADEKSARTSSDSLPVVNEDDAGAVPEATSGDAGAVPEATSGDAEGSGGTAEQTGDDLTARLYVNIGKREEATADDIRELISRDLGDDAARIGSVALRNTHAYVRVPEDLVNRVIDSVSGTSYKEREVVIERAKR